MHLQYIDNKSVRKSVSKWGVEGVGRWLSWGRVCKQRPENESLGALCPPRPAYLVMSRSWRDLVLLSKWWALEERHLGPSSSSTFRHMHSRAHT